MGSTQREDGYGAIADTMLIHANQDNPNIVNASPCAVLSGKPDLKVYDGLSSLSAWAGSGVRR